MKLLYLDCFAGLSGDMFLGALLELGVPLENLQHQLARLPLDGYQIQARSVLKQNIAATRFEVLQPHPEHHHHRGFTEIAALIAASGLSAQVQQRATAVFRRLGTVEAQIHGTTLEQVHFHEIGAIDSIVDIVGVCLGLELLQVDQVLAAPPPLGTGFVETAHGRFPIPAPATLALLTGVPTATSTEPGELVTPTGAALLREFCAGFGPLPALTVERIGYGAGTRELARTPNVLRAVLGTSGPTADKAADQVTVIETNIDDLNPQLYGDVMDRLLVQGALDVYLTPVQMKKNRPGTLLTVLCESAEADRLAELLLEHTTSFGVRMHETRRQVLARELVRVPTVYGEIEVKIGRRAGRILSRSPEYESCRRAAARSQVPVRTVQAAAARAAEEIL